jgi:hypothetical protein
VSQDILIQIAAGTGAVPIIMALTQIIKPFIPAKKFHPIIALVIGITLNFAVMLALVPLTYTDGLISVLMGMVSSFLASGIYDEITKEKK